MFKKDDFRTFIVIGIVCVICLIIGLIISFKSNTDKLKNVNEYNVFFSNVNYINNYINMIASGDEQAIYKILDDKYKENNNNLNNILYNNEYTDLTYFEADTMFYVEIKKNILYYIKGYIYDINHDGRELIDDNFSILLINDLNTNSYSLYPVDDNNYEEIINNIRKINIKNNSYNSIKESEVISKEQVCIMYLSNFLNITFHDINRSYSLLSNSMKKKYTNNSSYESYVNDNFGLVSTIADKCKLEESDDKRRYTVIDTEGNTYVFTEKNIMNYEVDFYLKNSLSESNA